MNGITTKLNEFMKQQGLTGLSIARSLNLSTTLVSFVRNNKLDKVSQANLKRIEDFIDNYNEREQTTDTTVTTHDMLRVHGTIDETMISCCMGIVYGKAGSGKTTAVKKYVERHPEAILIETDPADTTKSLLSSILEAIGESDPTGSKKEMFNSIVATLRGSERVLIVDEAENLSTINLDIVRRIYDKSGTPTVFVGTEKLLSNLRGGRHGDLLQLYSRIEERHKMKGLTDKDRALLFGDMGEHIKKLTPDIRRSCSIYRKAKRFSIMRDENLSATHIKMASQSVILN